MSEAYQLYRLENPDTAVTNFRLMFQQYGNYVKRDTAVIIDSAPTLGNTDCSATFCYRLHNGAVLRPANNTGFCDSTALSAMWFDIDPDGIDSSTEGVRFWIYTDGRIVTSGELLTGTKGPGGACPVQTASSSLVPSWFSWN